jgi:hypothetical protein
MKPVAIFRHFVTEGPGYFATYLDRNGLPWKLIKLDEGEAVPPSVDSFSGLTFMGGPMSANDDLPWIPPVLAGPRGGHERRAGTGALPEQPTDIQGARRRGYAPRSRRSAGAR